MKKDDGRPVAGNPVSNLRVTALDTLGGEFHLAD